MPLKCRAGLPSAPEFLLFKVPLSKSSAGPAQVLQWVQHSVSYLPLVCQQGNWERSNHWNQVATMDTKSELLSARMMTSLEIRIMPGCQEWIRTTTSSSCLLRVSIMESSRPPQTKKEPASYCNALINHKISIALQSIGILWQPSHHSHLFEGRARSPNPPRVCCDLSRTRLRSLFMQDERIMIFNYSCYVYKCLL